MHYIIDGYNLIRSADWLASGPLRDQRERLLRFIEEKKPHGSDRHQVTVVFDGRADVTGPRWGGSTQVLFSHGPDADQLIKDRVDSSANPREAVVVTNDRNIQKWVRGAGAKVLSCEAFLAAGRPSPPRGRPSALDSESMEDINEELKKLWKLK